MSLCSCPNCGGTKQKGCWYSRKEWRNVRPLVLARDMRVCQVAANCPYAATVVDHVDPVTPATPWPRFISPSNLRASCFHHNTARGVRDRINREEREGVGVPTHPLISTTSLFGRRA